MPPEVAKALKEQGVWQGGTPKRTACEMTAIVTDRLSSRPHRDARESGTQGGRRVPLGPGSTRFAHSDGMSSIEGADP